MQAVELFQQAGEFTPQRRAVVIFPDHGSRYMSKVYSDQWMQDQGFAVTGEGVEEEPKVEIIE